MISNSASIPQVSCSRADVRRELAACSRWARAPGRSRRRNRRVALLTAIARGPRCHWLRGHIGGRVVEEPGRRVPVHGRPGMSDVMGEGGRRDYGQVRVRQAEGTEHPGVGRHSTTKVLSGRTRRLVQGALIGVGKARVGVVGRVGCDDHGVPKDPDQVEHHPLGAPRWVRKSWTSAMVMDLRSRSSLAR